MTATSVDARTDSGSPAILGAITLGANQTWSIRGGQNQYGSLVPGGLDLLSGIAATANSLAIDLGNRGYLFSGGANDLGPVTITGENPVHSGANAGLNGLVEVGNLNAGDGAPVSLTDAELILGGAIGPITSHGGYLNVGISPGVVAATGAVRLDSASAFEAFASNDAQAGSSNSELSATGPVDLGGAQLIISGVTGATDQCHPLVVGDVYTLITTTSSLTGTFAGVPDGGVVTMRCSFDVPPTLRIKYTAHAVTATVLTPTLYTTVLGLSTSPRVAVANEPVTLTAQVGPTSAGVPDNGLPPGTVSFYEGDQVIPGCANEPVVTFNSIMGDQASCTTTFGASGYVPGGPFGPTNTLFLSAKFTPTDSSVWADSSRWTELEVARGATTTTLAATTNGQNDVLTAAVTPATTGPLLPSCTVEFLDGGVPIPGCQSQTLGTSGAALDATCAISYDTARSHQIVAQYAGDSNFTGSTTAMLSVQSSFAAIGVALTGLTKDHPSLRFGLQAHGVSRATGVRVALPEGLALSKRRAEIVRGVEITGAHKDRLSVSKGRLVVVLGGASARVWLTISGSALSESKALASAVEKVLRFDRTHEGHRRALLTTTTVTVNSGTRSPIEVPLKITFG